MIDNIILGCFLTLRSAPMYFQPFRARFFVCTVLDHITHSPSTPLIDRISSKITSCKFPSMDSAPYLFFSRILREHGLHPQLKRGFISEKAAGLTGYFWVKISSHNQPLLLAFSKNSMSR